MLQTRPQQAGTAPARTPPTTPPRPVCLRSLSGAPLTARSAPRNAHETDSPPSRKQAHKRQDDPRDQIVPGKVIRVVHRPDVGKPRDLTVPELGRNAGSGGLRRLRWFAVGGKLRREAA